MKPLNFTNEPTKRGACTRDASCATESYHKPGCPRIAELLAKMKERK